MNQTESTVTKPQHIVSHLKDFLEICLHQICYARQLYSKALFDRCQAYGVIVHRCRHPSVSQYISQLVASTEDLILIGSLRCVWVLIFDSDPTDPQAIIKERVEIRLQIDNLSNFNTIQQDTEHFLAELRALVLRLQTLEVIAPTIPGRNFRVIIGCKSGTPNKHNWISENLHAPYCVTHPPKSIRQLHTKLQDQKVITIEAQTTVQNEKPENCATSMSKQMDIQQKDAQINQDEQHIFKTPKEKLIATGLVSPARQLKTIDNQTPTQTRRMLQLQDSELDTVQQDFDYVQQAALDTEWNSRRIHQVAVLGLLSLSIHFHSVKGLTPA